MKDATLQVLLNGQSQGGR